MAHDERIAALAARKSDWRDAGRELRRIRITAGNSQRTIAEAVGIPRWKLSRIERGLQRIPPELVPKFAEALGVPLDLFVELLLNKEDQK